MSARAEQFFRNYTSGHAMVTLIAAHYPTRVRIASMIPSLRRAKILITPRLNARRLITKTAFLSCAEPIHNGCSLIYEDNLENIENNNKSMRDGNNKT